MHQLNDSERKLVSELAAQHRDAARQLQVVEMAIKVAISTMCASHGLEGDWKLSNDLASLEPMATPRNHAGEANVKVNMEVIKGGGQ